MSMKDQAIKLIISRGVASANKNLNMDYLLEKSQGEHRTLNFEIVDAQDIITGFGIVNGRLVEIGAIRNPTVTFRTTKDVFLSLCLQRITMEEAIFYGKAELVGENWLRDFKIFQPVFNIFKKVLNDVVPSDQQ